ncbi:MAG: hypothetical protein QOE17_1325 [Gaiellales bacterium]|jgi:hypothetical protein|nr:hypothetical protein [Gaiellales bacterium]
MRAVLGTLSCLLAVILPAGCGSAQSAGDPPSSSAADQPLPASGIDSGFPLDRIAEFARWAVKGLGNPTDYSVTVVEAGGTEAAQVLGQGDGWHATTRKVYVIVIRGDLVCDVCSYPGNDVAHFRGGPAIYEVDESTLSVSDFYFLEPNDHQPDLAALGDPVSVPDG